MDLFASDKDRLPGLLKAWVSEYAPPPTGRARLLRLARHLSGPDYSLPRPIVNFQPFVPQDWSRFGFAWDSSQLFKFGLNWTNFKA